MQAVYKLGMMVQPSSACRVWKQEDQRFESFRSLYVKEPARGRGEGGRRRGGGRGREVRGNFDWLLQVECGPA